MRRWFCLLTIVALAWGCGDAGQEGEPESSAATAAASPTPQPVSAAPVPSTTGGVPTSDGGTAQGAEADDGGTGSGIFDVLKRFALSWGSRVGDPDYVEEDDLDEDGVVGVADYACGKRSLAGLDCDPPGEGSGAPPPASPPTYQAARPFSNSQDCKFCHPRQFNEWRSSPHAYTGISPTFYSLVAAGQNSIGAGFMKQTTGTSMAGAVGNFCLPCHAPLAFIGLEGRYGGNNLGFADVQPQIPFVCAPGSPNAFSPCTNQTALADCGSAGACVQFEGRTCVNSPPQNGNTPFPRRVVHCTSDADCPGDTGPCVIAPAAIYYGPEAQEGINCESCHNMEPNHQRSCQQFREADSIGVLSVDIEERETNDGRRLRLGPYPVDSPGPGMAPLAEQGILADTVPPVANAFHESARVDTPLVVPHSETDFADPDNPVQYANPAIDPSIQIHVSRPTAVTCEELPYCGPGSVCQGGPIGVRGMACSSDRDCGGCGFDGVANTCGPMAAFRDGEPCETSIDCALASNASENLLERGIDDPADETIGPLTRATSVDGELDRPDGNFYRSSMLCGTCHDVRPPFANAILKSCQEQPSQVCSQDADCLNLNVGCSGNDCGPCVAENAAAAQIATAPHGATPAPVDVGNMGYRRVENLFTEWQISLYNHPDRSFCSGNSFRACTVDADCSAFGDGACTVNNPPVYGKIITCQDCHMSNFPLTPLIDGPPGVGTPVDKNNLYPMAKAALEGSQSDTSDPLPVRRVSTHYMAGVDLPLVRYPGQAVQTVRRQQLIDSGFKITLDATPAVATAGQLFEVHVTVENVGVGHRFPAGFSHERQNWIQVFVQEESKLAERGLLNDPFFFDPDDPEASAPCHLQRTIATSAEDSRDPVGAFALETAGCIFRSGFVLDKAHPETGEMTPDGSLDDEDPEDFFVAVGTRVRGIPGVDPRVEVQPGTEGEVLDVQYICEEATSETYRAAIAAGSGLDTGTDPGFPFQARICDPGLTPGSVPGHTAPGFGNPGCMESGGTVDVGPCVPEIELSDGNERGRCAHDLTRGTCQSDAECGPAGPCLFRCTRFPELECCDQNAGNAACDAFYSNLGLSECLLESQFCVGGTNDGGECVADSDCGGGNCTEVPICLGGTRSGLPCDPGAVDLDAECPLSGNCADAGPCRVENTGITNFQNQFRTTANGVCVDPGLVGGVANVRDGDLHPNPAAFPGGQEIPCFLNLQCALQGAGGSLCLISGQCSEDSPRAGSFCTNLTQQQDCAPDPGDTGTCNVEFNLELNGRPSESVFIQTHPFNFNSMPPFQPFEFLYDFEVPPEIAGEDLIVSVRLFNRHFPMRFLRNLIGTQTVRPPFLVEAQGDASNPNECNDPRTIDIDCFVAPVVTLGQAEAGGFIANPGNTVPTTATVSVVAPTP